MKVSSVSQINFSGIKDGNSKKRVNYVSYTGYGALGAGIACGVTAGMKKFNAHKYLAYAAGVLSLAHLGIVETNKYRYHQRKSKEQSNNTL